MKKVLLLVLMLVSVRLCVAQNGYIHGNGDPRTLSPVPNCGGSRFYIDDSTGKLYTAAQGSPCVWQDASGSSGSNPSTTALAGATVDYNFLDGAGTAVSDISGNVNTGALTASAPTWNTTGLVFTSSTAQGVSVPAAVNASKSFMFGVYINPLGTSANQPANTFPTLMTSSTGGTNFNLLYTRGLAATNFDAGSTYSLILYNNTIKTSIVNLVSGFNVFGVVCGTGGADKDHFYINGVEVASYVLQGTSCGLQVSGNLVLGSSGVSPWNASGFNGTFYRFAAFSTQLTAATIAKYTATIFADVQSRGVATSPVPVVQSTPQLRTAGDSITFGLGTANGWPALLTLVNTPAFTVTNYGVTTITAKAVVGSEPNRIAPLCATIGGPNVATVFLGTNDFNSASGATPAQVWASNVAEIQILKKAGCSVFVGTMLSRTGNSVGGTSNDVQKNAFDALIIQNAKTVGADGIIDFAADPLMGADGANAGANFQVDHVHPNDLGQAQLAKAASNSLNYYFGFKLSNPNVITSNTYQMLSGDGAVTAAPTANAAYTMPDCTGPSGETYTISNPQSAFTLSIIGGTNQPINGLATAITIPSNSTVTLKDVPNPKSVSGCHWAM